jgi:aromatic-L-amino-acid decarboxylase
MDDLTIPKPWDPRDPYKDWPEQIDGPLDMSAAAMREMGHAVTDLLVTHLATLRDQRAITRHSPTDPVLPLGPAPTEGQGFDNIISTLRELVFAYHAREPHPGFMAYVPSSPTFPAMVGDWIATGFNFYAGVWGVATGPNRLELIVIDWFRRWLSMPAGSGGLLTTGGSAANLTAIVAARHFATGGSAAMIPGLTVYTSDQAHSSVIRAAWIAGIDRSHVRSIRTDGDRRMIAAELERAIADDRANGLVPCAVVASAGTTNTGAVDPLHAIADLCEREKIWLHVDAAYGGFAALTEWGKTALSGIERADSVTLDPHKWLYVPFECGCLIAREPRRLYDTFSIFPEYLKDVQATGDEVNFANYGEQLTRYNRALKVWFSVNYYGTAAITQAIGTNIHLAALAEQQVRQIEGLEVLSPAQMGIMCFRANPSEQPDGPVLDAFNEYVLDRVNASGMYFISSTRLDGRYALRICVLGFRTTDCDIEGLIEMVADIAFTEAVRREAEGEWAAPGG